MIKTYRIKRTYRGKSEILALRSIYASSFEEAMKHFTHMILDSISDISNDNIDKVYQEMLSDYLNGTYISKYVENIETYELLDGDEDGDEE